MTRRKERASSDFSLDHTSVDTLVENSLDVDDIEDERALADADESPDAVKRKIKSTPVWQLAADCGNPHVPAYMRKGIIAFDREFVARLRLREHAHIIRQAERWATDASNTADSLETDGRYGMELDRQIGNVRHLLNKLTTCRIGKRSGLMFSLLCRSEKEQRFFDDLWRVFADIPQDHLRFETIILAVLCGTSSEIIQQARAEMVRFRVLMNNFLRDMGWESGDT